MEPLLSKWEALSCRCLVGMAPLAEEPELEAVVIPAAYTCLALCRGPRKNNEVCCVSWKWLPVPHPCIEIWENRKGCEDLICDYRTLDILVMPGCLSAFSSRPPE